MNQNSARMLSRRTQIVWALFFVSITSALLILQLGEEPLQSGLLLTKLASVDERPEQDPVFSSIDPSMRSKWSSIVIHHLGQPAGTAELVDRIHRKTGSEGLGFHFLIGNGNGLGDGDVHVGYRWLNQSAGAKAVGIDSSQWDDQTISICLVGNGNRRPIHRTTIAPPYPTSCNAFSKSYPFPQVRCFLLANSGAKTHHQDNILQKPSFAVNYSIFLPATNVLRNIC